MVMRPAAEVEPEVKFEAELESDPVPGASVSFTLGKSKWISSPALNAM